MFKWKKGKYKYLVQESRTKTQEFDKPTELRFFTNMGGMRCCDFIMPEILKRFIEDFDGIVDELIKTNHLDEFNSGAFLDEYIENIISLSRRDIQKQYIEHVNVIYSIRSIEQGYLLNFQEEEKQIRKYLEDSKSDNEEDERYEKKQLQIYAGSVA